MGKVYRYGALKEEGAFGEALQTPEHHLDIAAGTLDSPKGPELVYGGGLGRGQRTHRPGPYAPGGRLDVAWDITTIALMMRLALGNAVTNASNVTSVTDEDLTTGAGETSKTFTLAQQPVMHGSFEVYDDGGSTLQAHDNGLGDIIEDAASGITGKIDYVTGEVTLNGLTELTSYDLDYDYGYYEHVIKPALEIQLPSFSARVGKDFYEHAFIGCGLSQLTLTTEREFAMAALEIIAQKDFKETLVDISALKLPQESAFPLAFHELTFKLDSGAGLVDRSADVEGSVFTYNNNMDAEAGITVGSRFPRRQLAGELELDLSFNMVFEDTTEKEDFWGDAAGPSLLGPLEVSAELVWTCQKSSNLKMVLSFPRLILQEVVHEPSGRDRLVQAIKALPLLDPVTDTWLTATIHNFKNYAWS